VAYKDNFSPRTSQLIRPSDGSLVDLLDSIGINSAAAITDPSASANAVALLKGLLKQLQGTSDLGPSVMTQAQKDIVARAVENIVNTIGVENIKMFMPLWEQSGAKAYDLFNRDLTFTVNGATLGQNGPCGYCMGFDGVNDYLVQDSATENNTNNDDYPVNDSADKRAQKIRVVAIKAGFVRLYLKKLGAPNANCRVVIYTNSGGLPGAPVTNGTSEKVPCSSIGTNLDWRGFYFLTPPALQKNQQYWVVFEYTDTVLVDGSNRISWGIDSAGGYGEGGAVYTSGAWSSYAQSHNFGIWSDNLVLNTDYSVITLAKDNVPSEIASRFILRASSIDNFGVVIRKVDQGYYDFVGNDGSTRAAVMYLFPSVFTVYGGTFSVANSTGKVEGYANGFLKATGDGTALASQARLAHPLAIGASMNSQGVLGGYWSGLIGPTIITKNKLSQAQMGIISNELLCLRKYGVAA